MARYAAFSDPLSSMIIVISHFWHAARSRSAQANEKAVSFIARGCMEICMTASAGSADSMIARYWVASGPSAGTERTSTFRTSCGTAERRLGRINRASA